MKKIIATILIITTIFFISCSNLNNKEETKKYDEINVNNVITKITEVKCKQENKNYNLQIKIEIVNNNIETKKFFMINSIKITNKNSLAEYSIRNGFYTYNLEYKIIKEDYIIATIPTSIKEETYILSLSIENNKFEIEL